MPLFLSEQFDIKPLFLSRKQRHHWKSLFMDLKHHAVTTHSILPFLIFSWINLEGAWAHFTRNCGLWRHLSNFLSVFRKLQLLRKSIECDCAVHLGGEHTMGCFQAVLIHAYDWLKVNGRSWSSTLHPAIWYRLWTQTSRVLVLNETWPLIHKQLIRFKMSSRQITQNNSANVGLQCSAEILCRLAIEMQILHEKHLFQNAGNNAQKFSKVYK